MKKTKGIGVDVVYESVGKKTIEKSFRSLKNKGTCILFGFSSGVVSSINPQVMADAGSIFVTRPNLADYMEDADTVSKRAQDLFAYIKKGLLNVNINKVYPLVRAADAQKHLESGKSSGKVLLKTRN